MDPKLEERFAKAKAAYTPGAPAKSATPQLKAVTPKVNTTPTGQMPSGGDPYNLKSRFAKAKAAYAPAPAVRRDDGATRERYALRHPEMTGGEAGAQTRAINTGWVRAGAAKQKAQEEVAALQLEDNRRYLERRDTLPAPREETGKPTALDAAKQKLKAAESELADWTSARKYDQVQRVASTVATDPFAVSDALKKIGGMQLTRLEQKEAESIVQTALYSAIMESEDFKKWDYQGWALPWEDDYGEKKPYDKYGMNLDIATSEAMEAAGETPLATAEEERLLDYLIYKSKTDPAWRDNEDLTPNRYAQWWGTNIAAPRSGHRLAEEAKEEGLWGGAKMVLWHGARSMDDALAGLVGIERPISAGEYAEAEYREGLDTLPGIVFDASTTIADMAPSIGASILTKNPNVGLGVMAGSVFGRSTESALRDGYSLTQARLYGAANAASEAMLGRLLGGITNLGGGNGVFSGLLGRSAANINNGFLRFAAEVGLNSADEALEEYTQGVLDPVFRNMILGEDNEIKLISEDAAYDAFMALITTPILEGPSQAGAVIDQNKAFSEMGQKLHEMGPLTADTVLRAGLDGEASTQSHKLAAKLADRQVDGKKISDKNLGRLYQTILAEESTQKTAPGVEAVKADTSLFRRSVLQNLNQARSSFIEFARQHFPQSVINAETGRAIGISRTGLDKFLSGRIPYEKYASGFHIPELIERAHKVAQAANEHPGQMDSIPTYEYYDSPIDIDGMDYMAHIRVRNTRMGDRYYGHTISEIEDIKIEPSARTSVPGETPAVQPVNAIDGSIDSIPQAATDVKTAEAKVARAEQQLAELDRQDVARGAAELGAQGRATVTAMFIEGQNAQRYVQGMREVYAAGQAGVSMESVDSQAVRTLNDYQRRAAYEAGQMDGAWPQTQTAQESQTLGKVDQRQGEDLPFYFGSEEGAVQDGQEGVRVREGGQRLDGAGAEVAAGGVAEGAGGLDAGADRGGPADPGASALQVGRAVSTKALGIADGLDTDSVHIVTGGESQDLQRAKTEAQSQGFELVAFTGGNLHVQVPTSDGGIVTVEARGYIVGNKVYVRADHAEVAGYQLWRHELYHNLVTQGKVSPERTMQGVREQLGDELTGKLEAAYSRALGGITGVELWEEIAADQYGGINFFSGTVLEGEMEALGTLVGTQTDAQLNSQTAEGTDSTTGPPQGKKATATQERSGGKFSAERSDNEIYDYSKSFEEQLEDYEARKIPKNDTLLVCGTPKVFQKIGLLSLPMTMNQTHIDYALNGTKDMDHFLRKDGLLQLPAALEHPIAIISSKTKAGTSLVAMLEVRQNGKQVIVPVVIDGFGAQNGLRIDSNSLTSAYGKNYSISRVLYDALENEANGAPFSTYYVDAKKATELFRGARVPMPKMPATSNGGFIHSITEDGSPVKPRFEDVTQTQQFKRWFHGSKVVDAEGKPLVVYHGTDAEFTVFQSKDGSYWFGDEDYAAEMAHERGGERIVQAYLDMKNPYYATLAPGKFADPAFEGPIIQAAKEGGHDGVILSKDTDSALEADTFYVVFEPTQIKSATENIGAFDKNNPDIRFSQEPGEYVQELRELRRENERLKKQVDKLMGEFRLSGGPTVDSRAVRAEAGKLVKSLDVKGMTIDDVSQRMQSIYDLISTGRQGGDELSYGTVKEMAEDLARDLLTHAVVKDDSAYREYSGMRDYFKTTQVIISETDSRDIPDYADWRRHLGRRVNLRKAKPGEMANVDTVFHEAAEMWPEFFNEADISAASDQVRHIGDIVTQVSKITEVNPYSLEMEEAVQWTANDILHAYGEMPMGKGTIADQWDAKVRRAQVEARERVRRVTEYERERSKAKLAEMKAWYAERDARAREYKKNGEARNRLLKLTQRLERMKTTTANKALIRELIGELDTVARHLTGTKRMNLEELRQYYADKSNPNSDFYDPDFIPDERVGKELDRLSRKHIDDMTQEDVESLTKALLNLEHEIRTSKRLLQEEENRTVYQLGKQVIDEMEAVHGSKATGVGAALDKFVTSEVLSPVRMVRRMTGWRDGSPLLKATEALNRGQRAMLDYQMKAEKPFLRFSKDKAFVKMFSGPEATEVKIGGWTREGLKEVTITPAMRASIYLHSQNPQNARHMAEGGVTVPDMKLYKKGKLAEAYARGTTIKINPSDTQRLFWAMSEKERAFVREAQKYFREVSQPELSKVAETLRGYSPTMLENYFPIVTNKNFMRQEITFDAEGTATILKPGYLEERINASGPMMLQDVDSVIDRAIQQHGLFVGLAVPVRNFNKLWNVSTVGLTEGGEYYSYAGSVKDAVSATWGETGKRYIEKMVKDVQGRQNVNDQWGSFWDRLRGNYAGAVLTLNASVAIKQAASYPTAAAVLGWGPLVKAGKNFGSVDLDLIAKYTPLQWYRSKGFASKELGDMARNNKRTPKLLNWIQGMDLATTRKLWKASEYYVRDHNKALKVGSDAYYQAVADIYNRVIEETQPNYTAMQRPQLLRSESDLMKNLAMFKTQPMQNLNILYDAAGDYLAKRRQFKAGDVDAETVTQARRNLGNAVTSQLVQAGVFAGMTLLWALFRGKLDKYKDEETDEVTASSLMRAFGVDMGMNLVSGVPVIPDVADYFVKKVTGERAYAMDVTSVSMIFDGLDAVAKIAKATAEMATEEDKDLEGFARTVWDAGEEISKDLGIPVENVTNLIAASSRRVLILGLGQYRGEYQALRMTTDKDKYKGDYYDNLYKAMVNDPAAYREIYDQMIEDGFAPEKIKSAMEDRMKAAQGVEKVGELEHRYVSPEDEGAFNQAMGRLEGSHLWQKATAEQQKDAEDELYKLLTSESKSTQKVLDKLEAARLPEWQYALYQLAVDIYDEPNENGNLGTITNAEREAAIRAIGGLTDRERSALWIVGGGSEKSNPWG